MYELPILDPRDTRPVTRQIADRLREAIESGDLPPGSRVPGENILKSHYGVARSTARDALAVLANSGLLTKVPKIGTFVRERPPRHRLTRDRMARRDDYGYYFDPAVQPWRPLVPLTVSKGRPPPDVVPLLEVEPGDDVMIRDRTMGDPQTGEVHQLATSYLPLSLVEEIPVLGVVNSGPGGIYDRIEEAGHGPLTWREVISARAASDREIRLLKLSSGVPVLRILRVTSDPTGAVCEVYDMRVDAERWEIGYRIHRATGATPT